MEPAFDFWTVAMTIAASQGVFLSILIFLRKSKINNLLGGLILSFSLCILFYVLYWTNYLSYFPFQIRALGGMTFIMGPLMLFYIRSGQRLFYYRNWHFLPALMYLSLFFIVDVWILSPYLEVVQNIHLAVYALFVYLAVKQSTHKGEESSKLVAWRFKLAWAFSGYAATFLTYYLLVWTGQLELSYDYAISIASCIFIYYIGIQGFSKHDLLQQYDNGKYANGLLPKSAAESILKKVKSHMQNSRPYLNSDLRLNELAEALQISSHDLSQALNKYEGKSFTDFVNEFRVESAKKELRLSNDKKIIHVAYDCGFNNKVSFNNAFKKFTGVAPSQFRLQHSELVATD
ncbi:MAG: helix-turn-helix domain-containing protein [Cyclobacteriaceae bacterium]